MARTSDFPLPKPLDPARFAPPSAQEIQSAALPYRVTPAGLVEFLLITTRRARRWGLPKGKIPCTMSMAASAAKEAYEEAGVVGEIAPLSCTSYRKMKRGSNGRKILLEVWVYPLRVTESRASWPEQGHRQLRWCGAEDAVALLGEAILGPPIRQLCLGARNICQIRKD